MLRALCVLGLLLAGCAGGPTDEERVDAALLRLSDFPPDQGWVVEPETTDDPAQAELEAGLDQCEQDLDPTFETRAADRDSESFTRGEFVLVASNAAVVSDEAVRDQVFDALEPLVDCAGAALQEALSAQLGEEVPVTVTDRYPIEVSTAAERTEGHAIQLDMGAVGSFFVDLVAIEEDTTMLYGSFLHTGELTLDDEEQILAPAVERMKES